MSTFQLSTDDIISYLQTELDKVGFSENHRNELFNSIIGKSNFVFFCK